MPYHSIKKQLHDWLGLATILVFDAFPGHGTGPRHGGLPLQIGAILLAFDTTR